jgi:ribose 5-phosphate isomerase B
MRIGFASDHAGYELKERLKLWAEGRGHTTVDFGAHGTEPVDYPDFVHSAASQKDSWDRLVLVCGSGVGVSITANRHVCIRCALVADTELARLAREHNNANAIAMGQRFVAPALAEACLEVFLGTEFEGGRHQRRVDKIDGIVSIATDTPQPSAPIP